MRKEKKRSYGVDPQDRVSPGSTSRDGIGYAGSATRRFPYYTLDNPFHTIGYILPLVEDCVVPI